MRKQTITDVLSTACMYMYIVANAVLSLCRPTAAEGVSTVLHWTQSKNCFPSGNEVHQVSHWT